MNTKVYSENLNVGKSSKLSAISFRCTRIEFHCFIFTGLLLIISGCGDSFQPFQENDQYYFSIFGYLDASADTQWVRVTPARQEYNMPQEIPDMLVTLQHIESGKSVIMNDSLFVSGEGFTILNFWTTMDMEPEQTYRLKAEYPSGNTSMVMITTPEDFSTPIALEQTSYVGPTTYSLYVDDSVEHLIDVRTKWYVRFYAPGFEENKLYTFSYKDTGRRIPAYGGVYSFPLKPKVERNKIEDENRALLRSGTEMEILHRQIFVASGGPEWNEDISSLDDVAYALPGNITNVENGLGYMVGVISKTVPYATCYNEQHVLILCEEEKPFW